MRWPSTSSIRAVAFRNSNELPRRQKEIICVRKWGVISRKSWFNAGSGISSPGWSVGAPGDAVTRSDVHGHGVEFPIGDGIWEGWCRNCGLL